MNSDLRHLCLADYVEKPWKNRRGSTQDIVMLPTGASDADFDLRMSLTPLPAAAPFSAFPGIDRVITLIAGTTLSLEFGDTTRILHCGDSFAFGPETSPFGVPDTPARVINVMARRAVWRIDHCRVLPHIPAQETDGFTGIIALEPGTCRVNTQNRTMAALDSILLSGTGTIETGCRCLFVKMHPTSLQAS